ncbi:MAG: hypothetical protein V1820_04485 [archaeon]
MTSLKSKFWKAAGDSELLTALSGADEIIYYRKGEELSGEKVAEKAGGIFSTDFGVERIPILPFRNVYTEQRSELLEIPEIRRETRIALVEIDGDTYRHVADVEITRNALTGNYANISFPAKDLRAKATGLEAEFKARIPEGPGEKFTIFSDIPAGYSPNIQLWAPVEASKDFPGRAGEVVSQVMGIYSD